MKRDVAKIVFVCTEDWFFSKHFQHLAEYLANSGKYEVVLISNTVTDFENLKGTKIRVIHLNFQRASLDPFTHAKMYGELRKVLAKEQPDVVHFIAFKTIILGGMACQFLPKVTKIFHLTGQGFYIVAESYKIQLQRMVFLRLLRGFLKKARSILLIENTFDLYAVLGEPPKTDNYLVLGGAGVDPEQFPLLPLPENEIPKVAFVGRLVWSKGLDILVEGIKILHDQGIRIQLDIYGDFDTANPRVVTRELMEEWTQHPSINWHGRVDYISKVWAKSDIAAFPSRGGEGIPRALLEASATGRPVIVTDVPGCRNFVRDGTEGIIVPKESGRAIADALKQLVQDPKLRQQMGEAGRKRILEGYTESHLQKKVEASIEELLAQKTR